MRYIFFYIIIWYYGYTNEVWIAWIESSILFFIFDFLSHNLIVQSKYRSKTTESLVVLRSMHSQITTKLRTIEQPHSQFVTVYFQFNNEYSK